MKKTFSIHRTWEHIRTVPGLGRNLIALLVLIVLGVISSSVILGNQRFVAPWEDRFEFSADFTQAPAINAGQHPKVLIAGVEVGQIKESALSPEGKARITMTLEPGQRIYRNARLVLRPSNPLNEMYVQINPGGPPAPELPPRGVIPVSQTVRPIQPDEVLNELDDRTQAAVRHLLVASDVALANAPKNLPAGLNEADTAMMKFRPLLVSLRERRENLARLVTALSEISTAVGHNKGRVTELMASTHKTLATLSERNGDLEQTIRELPGTSRELKNAMTGVGSLTGQLNPTLDNLNAAAKKLPQALRKTSDTMGNLGRAVRAARPVVSAAGPVVDDLRPLVGDVHRSLGDLEPTTRLLQPNSKLLVSYLTDLQAFIFNTSSVFSLSDKNGGFIRGHLTVPLPDGGAIPGSRDGNDGRRPR